MFMENLFNNQLSPSLLSVHAPCPDQRPPGPVFVGLLSPVTAAVVLCRVGSKRGGEAAAGPSAGWGSQQGL